MKHGSLFSGIGGFDLAAQWMGWENAFHCEIAEFPRKVLHHYWPNALSYENIKETDFTCHRGKIDVISGGFPCQPYSLAGKRLGKEDDRHLWPEMLRCIREIKPRWVVGENVFGIVNWNGGLVFDEVQSDLEAEGYEVQAYVLPACAVNAPHRRDRIWFVAHSNHKGGSAGCGQVQSEDGEVSEWHDDAELSNAGGGITTNTEVEGLLRRTNGRWENNNKTKWSNVLIQSTGSIEEWTSSDTSIAGQQELHIPSEPEGKGYSYGSIDADASNTTEQGLEGSARESVQGGVNGFAEQRDKYVGFRWWEDFPTTQPTIRRGDDGISDRLDGITFSKWRNESIKAYGNAVVPQVVYQIFKAIEAYEALS